MEKLDESSEVAEMPVKFNDSEVMNAWFRMESETTPDGPERRLYLRTYKKTDADGIWIARREADWPLIAILREHEIVMRPIYTNPHTLRYLTPKNGRFSTIVLIKDWSSPVPDSASAAQSLINAWLPSGVFDPLEFGLGFNKDFDVVWRTLAGMAGASKIVVSKRPEKHTQEGVVSLGTGELDELRRAFNRITKNGRELIRRTKAGEVFDRVLTRLDPIRFRTINSQSGTLVRVERGGVKQIKAREREERRSTVRKVQNDLGQLAVEAPEALATLHADIERVTLQRMVITLTDMLEKKLPEKAWQLYLESNIFVLSLAFSKPVQLLHTQFHARGSGLARTGAQIGDFLFKGQGQGLALVEIKTPETPLLQGRPYRGEEVFGPSTELSGAVSQILFQQSELRKNWATHFMNHEELRSSGSESIHCVVLAGRLPLEKIQARSFEVYRHSTSAEVITFDELLSKLKYLLASLTPENRVSDDLF